MEKKAIVAEELTKFYGKARGIGLAYWKYRRKDIR